jgi:bacteriocin-like protein
MKQLTLNEMNEVYGGTIDVSSVAKAIDVICVISWGLAPNPFCAGWGIGRAIGSFF